MRLPAPRILVGVAVAAVFAAGLAFAWRLLAGPMESAQVTAGRVLYSEYCAACHGAELQGQADWQVRLPSGRLPAPPHDASGHTWHHADSELLRITKHGLAALVPGYESDMPAFADILTDDEIRAVLAFIRSTWPDRERDYQAARTKARP